MDRKPLARLERRDIPRSFKFTESEDATYQRGAVEFNEDFSTYCRECLAIGHSLRQTQKLVRRTVG